MKCFKDNNNDGDCNHCIRQGGCRAFGGPFIDPDLLNFVITELGWYFTLEHRHYVLAPPTDKLERSWATEWHTFKISIPSYITQVHHAKEEIDATSPSSQASLSEVEPGAGDNPYITDEYRNALEQLSEQERHNLTEGTWENADCQTVRHNNVDAGTERAIRSKLYLPNPGEIKEFGIPLNAQAIYEAVNGVYDNAARSISAAERYKQSITQTVPINPQPKRTYPPESTGFVPATPKRYNEIGFASGWGWDSQSQSTYQSNWSDAGTTIHKAIEALKTAKPQTKQIYSVFDNDGKEIGHALLNGPNDGKYVLIKVDDFAKPLGINIETPSDATSEGAKQDNTDSSPS